MTYLEYLKQPNIVALLTELYAFGVVSKAQYVHCRLLLAYIDMRERNGKMSDSECAYQLSQDPQYALSEGSILQVIKWAKRDAFCKVEVAK